jgi:hypothetical protein
LESQHDNILDSHFLDGNSIKVGVKHQVSLFENERYRKKSEQKVAIAFFFQKKKSINLI